MQGVAPPIEAPHHKTSRFQTLISLHLSLFLSSSLPLSRLSRLSLSHTHSLSLSLFLSTLRRKEAENLHNELETEIGIIKMEHDEKHAEKNAAL